jgi:transcription antitermination factor NusB
MIVERSAARRLALQALYQLDVQGPEFLSNGLQDFVAESTDDPKTREIAYFMTKAAWAYHDQADAWLTRLAAKWPPHRMATVDRNILRLAVWELVSNPRTPPKVVLVEAVDMAKEFSTADSGTFINGVLDAVMREHLAQTGKPVEEK